MSAAADSLSPQGVSGSMDFVVEELETLDAPGFLGWDKETWLGAAIGAGATAGIALT
ncbi:hypothetical protein ACH4GK_16585 [Streptomyces rimosus]|uniref:hypothetical protein n=1 Tax=Streptomyces rimosus TaxID=1927 RepID=UPI000A66213D|nr:hypothetical protein [Streptomyces rimosus]